MRKGIFFAALFLLSYLFLGLKEEVVLAAATLLFVLFFVFKIHNVVEKSLFDNLMEVKENYYLSFFLRKSSLFRTYMYFLFQKAIWFFYFKLMIYDFKLFQSLGEGIEKNFNLSL